MPEDLALTIHYEETDDGWVAAQLNEVPAAVSFGRTRPEAREAVLDALRELALSYLDVKPGGTVSGENEEVIRIHAAAL